jgi:prefoldin subunit 5
LYNRLKDKLDAYEKELNRLRAEIKDLKAQQKSLIERKKKLTNVKFAGNFTFSVIFTNARI